MTTRVATPARVTLVTEVDFWNGGAGHRARILALVRYLATRLQLTVVMPTPIPEAQRARCLQACPGLDLRNLNLPAQVPMRQALTAFHQFLVAEPMQACIIEYLHLGWLRAAVPRGVLTLVDTHDVVSQRDADFVRTGRQTPWPMTSEAQERARLDAFDRVIAISAPDAALFSRWLGAQRVLLAPHAHAVCPLPVRETASRVLFIGSAYLPNVDGLAWLLREVWPLVQTAGARLDVVGAAGASLAKLDMPADVQLHGPVADLHAAYVRADLCVNPVRYGSGLKIKSVEALAHGRPLVCTSHAARGLGDSAEPAFLTADDAIGFAAAIDALLSDAARRRALCAAGLDLVARHFNEDTCYGPLCRTLLAPVGDIA